jgi:hypothetical protein
VGYRTYSFEVDNNDRAQSSTVVILRFADHGVRKLLTSTSFLSVVTGYGKRLYGPLAGSWGWSTTREWREYEDAHPAIIGSGFTPILTDI